MFKCQKCKKSDVRPIRVVTKRKMVTHRDGNQGSQIEEELNICAACLPDTPEAYKPPRVVIEKKSKKAAEEAEAP